MTKETLEGNCMDAKMSARHKGCTDWMDDKEWYYIDYKTNRFMMTDKAPANARESFEQYKKINNLDY